MTIDTFTSPCNTMLKYNKSTVLLLVLLSNCCIHNRVHVQGFTATPAGASSCSSKVAFDSTASANSKLDLHSSSYLHSYSYSSPSCISSPLWTTSTLAPHHPLRPNKSTLTSTSLQFQSAQYADDHLRSRNININNPHPHPHPQPHQYPHSQSHSPQPSSVKVTVPPLPNTSDPYVLFNLPPHATKLDIKRAYRRAALMYHPDARITIDSTVEERQRANDDFARINAAYAILTGKEVRKVRRNQQRGRAPVNHPNKSYGGTSNGYTPHGYSHNGNGHGHNHGSTVGRHPPHHHRGGGASANANANTHANTHVNTSTTSPRSHHQAQAQAHTYANVNVNVNARVNTNANSNTNNNRHAQTHSQPNPNSNSNTHQQHVHTQAHRPTGNARYSRQGYGGTSTTTTNGAASSHHSTNASASTSTSSTANPVPGPIPGPVPTRQSYSRQGYGGTSSAYAQTQSTEGVNSSRYADGPSASKAANPTNPVNQQNTGRRAAVNTKYVRKGYGGTSSSYSSPYTSPHPSRFTDNGAATTSNGAPNTNASTNVHSNANANVNTNVNTHAPKKRRAAASTQYSQGNYGGTSSAYYGTAGKHSRTVKSNVSGNGSSVNTSASASSNTGTNTSTNSSSSSNDNKTRRRSGASPKRYYGYGGTSSGFSGASAAYSAEYHVSTDNTQPYDPESEERRRKGDFFDSNRFHSQWNASSNGGGGYKAASTTTNGSTFSSNQQGQTSGSSSSTYSSSNQHTSSPQSHYTGTTVETPEKTHSAAQTPRPGDFFNPVDFHSKWNPSNGGTVNNYADSNTQQKTTASGPSFNKNPSDFTNANKFHSTYSSNLNAEEEERKYNEAVVEAARKRAEEMTAKLKEEGEAKLNNDNGNVGGLNGIFKSMTNLFSNNAPPSTAPKEKVCRVPRPPQGQQFTPFQACTIIEQHEKDPGLDKVEAMRIMLSNHYVPVRRSQLYNVYKKYQQGSILRDNRWGQY